MRLIPCTERGSRLLCTLLVLGLNFLYFPINRLVTDGVESAAFFDQIIPLWPVWAVPYILSLFWWIAAVLWAAVLMEDHLFRTMIIAVVIMILSSYLVYILYPTYVQRPELEGDSWAIQLMRLIYVVDRSYNALPSGHTYNTALIAMIWWRWQPHLRPLWVMITAVVILSTLFTRQHNILDAVFGLLWAWWALRIASRLTGWGNSSVTA